MIEEAFLAGHEVEPGCCDGRTLTIADHPELYETFGTRYGGDGVTTFALPDVPPINDLALHVKAV